MPPPWVSSPITFLTLGGLKPQHPQHASLLTAWCLGAAGQWLLCQKQAQWDCGHVPGEAAVPFLLGGGTGWLGPGPRDTVYVCPESSLWTHTGPISSRAGTSCTLKGNIGVSGHPSGLLPGERQNLARGNNFLFVFKHKAISMLRLIISIEQPHLCCSSSRGDLRGLRVGFSRQSPLPHPLSGVRDPSLPLRLSLLLSSADWG